MKHHFLLPALLAAGIAVAEPPSPYAGFQDRDIKALSGTRFEGYQSGKGMGQAMAAELNGYPGPKHVLDLSEELDLTGEQIERTRAIFDRMHARAVRLGERIVERERELDQAFAAGDMDEQRLESMLMELGKLKGRLRYTHLAAHLDQRPLLTDEQVEAYWKHRGYAGQGEFHDHVHDH